MVKSPQENVTQLAPLAIPLAESKLFTSSQVEKVLQKVGEKEWKDKLTANTSEALDKGAFET